DGLQRRAKLRSHLPVLFPTLDVLPVRLEGGFRTLGHYPDFFVVANVGGAEEGMVARPGRLPRPGAIPAASDPCSGSIGYCRTISNVPLAGFSVEYLGMARSPTISMNL